LSVNWHSTPYGLLKAMSMPRVYGTIPHALRACMAMLKR
jgi:hypothetical protein